MALSDKKILEGIKKGKVVIFPFRKNNLSTSSYDVTLGEYYFREQEPNRYHHIFDIYSKKHVEKVWGTKARKAKKARDVFHAHRSQVEDFDGIKPDDKVIVLKPGETILAHTKEFIGGVGVNTSMMKARSSFGRVFIEVCKCAGWGDVGYISRWTMEITNNSRYYTIPLVVGRSIAQIIFFKTGRTLNTDYSQKGKYQEVSSLAGVKKQWKPEMMLPRLWKEVNSK